LRDKMTDRKMRPTHIHDYLPVMEELVFVPSDAQREAKKLRATWEVRRRRHLYGGPWRSYLLWQGPAMPSD